MSTVAEILAAVRQLSPDELSEVRRAINTVEEAEWEKALDQSTADWRQKGLTDDDIDAAVLRRRYEGRA